VISDTGDEWVAQEKGYMAHVYNLIGGGGDHTKVVFGFSEFGGDETARSRRGGGSVWL